MFIGAKHSKFKTLLCWGLVLVACDPASLKNTVKIPGPGNDQIPQIYFVEDSAVAGAFWSPANTEGLSLALSVRLEKWKVKDEKEANERLHELVARNPVAPSVAEIYEQTKVDVKQIIRAYKQLTKVYDFVIVEGIGGLMVPLQRKYYVANLIRDMKLPVLIVSHDDNELEAWRGRSVYWSEALKI